jgi:type IV pilus assembly protein PilQ
MNKRFLIFFACGILLVGGSVFAQSQEEQKIKRAARGKDVVTQEELVNFKNDVPYTQAIESLSALSKKFLKKPIIDPSPLSTKINVEIQSMYWRDAFELILRTNNLWYVDQPDYIQVMPVGALPATPGAPITPGAVMTRADSGQILARTRDVMISAIFVEIDQSKLRESGISYSIFRGRDLNLGVEFLGSERVSSNIFTAAVAPISKKLSVDIGAALRIFESEQLGEVIARPQSTVRSGATGRVQIGTDFSVKERDFSGNVMDRFYSTGTILQVTPTVYTYGKTVLIDLTYQATRSNVTPGTVSTLINKTESQAKLLLLDGEESYVAGLVIQEENTTREGIPLLKDLPWWVFGLRYVFGYDKVSVSQKDLLILLRADLVPTVDERIEQLSKGRNVIQEKLKEGREELEKRMKKQ